MAICRFCKKYEYTGPLGGAGSMIKYGPRHYAHGTCIIDRLGEKVLELPSHQLCKLPFMRLQELVRSRAGEGRARPKPLTRNGEKKYGEPTKDGLL